jgi:nitrogenase-associated protein
MACVIFYENPDCSENARQKALLVASGHTVEARDLTAEPWTVSSLRPYFAEKNIRDWFNPASSRLKKGDIDLDTITPQAALVAMILDPLLIRAPLMRIGDRCEAGFDPERVHGWIGLAPISAPQAMEATLAASFPVVPRPRAEAAK